MEDILKKISERTKELNEMSDRASRIVTDIESKLEPAGVEVSVLVDDEQKLKLCYGRYNDKYRICIQNYYCNARPFVECPREYKLRTIDHLPKLIEAIYQVLCDHPRSKDHAS